MARLTIQDITPEAIQPVLSAADAAGDEFPNAGREFVEVKNDSGAGVTVTIETAMQVDGTLNVEDRQIMVGNGERRQAGPFRTSIYNQAGVVKVTYSAAPGVTIGVFRLAQV